MPTSLCPPLIAAPRLRAAVAVLMALALSLSGALLLHQSAADAAKGLSTIRLTAGHRRVDHAGHVWRRDDSFARGGHITRSVAKPVRIGDRLRYERTGRFSYDLDAEPGVYSVHLEMIGAAHVTTRALSMTTATPTFALFHRAITTVGDKRAYSLYFRVKITTGHLRLHFGPRDGVASLALIGRRSLPTRQHVPTSTTPTSTTPTSTTPTSTTPTSTAPTSTAPTSTAPTSTGSTSPTSQSPDPSAPSTTSASSTLVPAGDVTPEDFGAAGNGTTDDTSALQNAFDNAAGRTVYLPAGHVYAHDAVLQLRVAGLHVTGPGELLATNEQESSVWIEADNVLLDGGVQITTASTTQRWGTWDQMGVRLVGHSGITLRDVSVQGSAAAGIYVGGAAHNFVLDHVTVSNTRADGIHMTEGSYDGQVIDPVVRNSGDDGVAVVSYQQDGTPCHDITVTSPTVLGTSGGRGVSVVGGNNITETGLDVEGSSAAAVYIAAEGSPWYTAAPSDVTITGGKIVNANTDSSVDHGAVVVLSGESDVTPSDITVSNLTISKTRSSASRDIGVISYGAAPTSVLFSNLAIIGGPTTAYEGNAPQSSFALRHIVQNGTVLPDQG